MTKQESALLALTAQVWNAYLELPIQHPDDQTEFRHALHALQRIVLSRPAMREAA